MQGCYWAKLVQSEQHIVDIEKMDANLAPFLNIVALLLVVIGLVGTVLPMLPGVPLVFAGLWLAAWVSGYMMVGKITIAILGVLMLISLVVDFAATALGARRVGASRQAITGAVIGTVVGVFFGLPGLLIGPFVGAVAGELSAQRSLEQATVVGVATWIGLLLGTIAKLALACTMIGFFIAAYFI